METETDRGNRTAAFATVTTLFFAWGFVTSNNDPLIAALKAIYSLSNTEALLTQFAFFLAYAVVSLPAAALLARLGSANTILAALGLMVAGCVTVLVASNYQTYELVLVALFMLAAGITALQVAANPLAASLGRPERSAFRLTLAQAFNSVGVVLGVQIGSSLMLKGRIFEHGASVASAAERAAGLASVDRAFGFIAALLASVAILIWATRAWIDASVPRDVAVGSPLAALRSRWAVRGAAAIFLYVGAEVSIGSIMILFLQRLDVLGLSASTAGSYLAWIYWFGALVGRFVGSWLLTILPAPRLVLGAAAMAAALAALAFIAGGAVGAWAALSIGLFNAILFPTIFSMTLERSSAPAPATSGLLCVAIVGGAVLPIAVGQIADSAGLKAAFALPALAYVGVMLFALAAARARVVSRADAGTLAVAH